MARYIVKVASGGRTASLLVVLSPDQLCSALLGAIQARLPAIASKLGLAATNNHHITLHLETEDGPLINTEDILSTVLPNAKETVYAVIEQTQTPTQPPAPTGPVLQLRVLTPELAHEHADVNSIATTAKPLPLSTTLSELRITVCQHLGVPIGDGALAQFDCNCSAARQIDANASLNERGSSDSDALHTLVVVYDDNKVAILQTQEPTLTSIRRAAREHLQDKAVGRLLSAIGGVADHNVWDADEVQYIKLPVLSVCSHQSHRRATGTESESDAAVDGRGLTLDLHTVECPLEITVHNKDVTLEAAGLYDCTIDGVLTVYAVQRVCSQGRGLEAAPNVGKAAIFQKRHPWEHPLGQSERGLANLLSTLHKFTDVTSGREMEECQQDAVLRIVNLMTRLPPAVRTAYVLMRGETPHPSECAALSQCLYEILKDMIPRTVIRNDPQRFFEGSRLLLGLILGKAKTLRVSASNSRFPYTTMRVYDLRNAVTMLPVRGVSVQAKSGLVDVGLYVAFAEDGVLNWDNGTDTTKASTLDRRLSRVATLSGGTKAKIVVFNPDAVAFATKYPDKDISTVVAQSEATNLQYLATMCSSNELSVVPPSDLASASAPVLTLDRDGFLAVHVGREGCGSAGRDILMFRPLSGEEAIDVSVITQLLVPILARRNADGTAVFEAYGSHHRQVREPDEAVVVCVDLSQSMNKRCGFIDIEENEDATASIRSRQPAVTASTISPIEHPGGERLALEELKEFLQNHESFEDMLAIVHAGNGDRHRLQNASIVLQVLGQLDQQQLKAKTEGLAIARQRATSFYYRNEAAASQSELITLSNRIARMKRFADSLCAFLNYRAEIAGSLPELHTWQPGAAAPPIAEQRAPPIMIIDFTIPNELLCPISSELMEDPVMTVDGFTYERKNIERWLYNRRTSPLTNLELSSSDLRSDALTKEKINAYVSGHDLYTIQTTADTQTVSMKTPLGSYTVMLPRTFVMKDLYELAFRKTMGRYPKFELRHKNAVLSTSSTQTLQMTIASADEVFVTPLDYSSSSSSARPGAMCLIKVYDLTWSSTPVCSYWEPKNCMKTLASVVFRYYRQLFSKNSYISLQSPLTVWRSLCLTGDGHRSGQNMEHWSRLSGLLNSEFATGSIHEEPLIDDRSPALSRRNDTIVLKLGLGGPPSSSPAHKQKTLSRLDVLKQMFDAFVNRLLAYNLQTHVGLVTFGTSASLSQGITHAVEDFRHHLNNMKATGDTAVWDSIALAMDQLQQYASKYPKSKLRIICISDGEDNKSNRLVHELAAQLGGHNIVVDSFCLGDANNTALQTLSYMTGGYKFEPASLEEAMAICEMEPVFSVLERPAAVVPRFSSRHAGNALWRFQQARKSITVDRATRDDFPQRKSHPQLAGSFVELTSFARHASSQARADSNLRLSRIHTEIRNCGALGHPHYDIYICEENFGFWKIVMQGPPESTYAGGTFLLYVEMGEDYPMSPPKVRFVTSVYHPNINRHGRICHSILDRNWTVDTTTKNLIDTIYSLLLVPEFSDPINTVVTLNYHWDEVQFKEEAQSHIRKYATKTRAEWRAEITS